MLLSAVARCKHASGRRQGYSRRLAPTSHSFDFERDGTLPGMASKRLLIVSNRLPVTARLFDGRLDLRPSSGRLATGLTPWHESSNGL